MLKLYTPHNMLNDAFYDSLFDLAWPSTRRISNTELGTHKHNAESGEREYTLEVPGYGKENIELSYKNNVLYISGELKNSEGKAAKSFKTKVSFPDVDRSTINARVVNGILTVKGNTKDSSDEYRISVE